MGWLLLFLPAPTQAQQVVGWGDNSVGETTVPAGLSPVVAISAGGIHSLALKGDGTVVGWGDDGDGETDVPAGLGHVVAIAAGGYHSLALIGNSAPRLTTPLQTGGTFGVPLAFTATATDTGLSNYTLTFTLLNPPAGMHINAATGQLTFTPPAAGTYLACIRVTDQLGAANTALVAIEATPPPLVVTGLIASRVSAKTVTVTFNLSNTGTAALTNVRVTLGKLGSTNAQLPLPGSFTIQAGNAQSVTLTFSSTESIPSGYLPFVMGGSYQSGSGATLTFSSGVNVSVP